MDPAAVGKGQAPSTTLTCGTGASRASFSGLKGAVEGFAKGVLLALWCSAGLSLAAQPPGTNFLARPASRGRSSA